MNRVKQQLFADYPLNKGQRMIQIIFHIIFDRLHVSYDHVLMAENEILPSRSISSYCFVLSQKKKKKKARMVWSEACEFKRHDVNIQESRVFSFFLFMFVYDITFSRNLTTNNLHHKLVCWQAPLRGAGCARGKRREGERSPGQMGQTNIDADIQSSKAWLWRVCSQANYMSESRLWSCCHVDSARGPEKTTKLGPNLRKRAISFICTRTKRLFFLTRVFIKYLKCRKKYSFGVWILEFRLIQCLLRFNYSFTFRRSTSVIFPCMSEESFSLSDALSFSFDKQIKNGRTRRK